MLTWRLGMAVAHVGGMMIQHLALVVPIMLLIGAILMARSTFKGR